jgi:hypothetical protein
VRHAGIRLALSVVVLTPAYYYLLIFIVGWTSAVPWPTWWFELFPSRHVGAMVWMVPLHTIAVFSAALPVAIASVVVARKHAWQLGGVVAFLATVAALLPSLSPAIWPLIWSSQPMLFITDQIELIVAVPLVAWIVGSASSNYRFERSRLARPHR